MLARIRPRLNHATVVAYLALFVALGGGALAAGSFTGSDGQIHACVSKDGQLILVNPGHSCHNGRSALAWSQRLFVQVDSATDPPTATRGSGVVKIDGPTETGSVGYFEVTFNRNVSQCAPIASRSSPDGNFPGVGSVSANHTSANAIGVQTSNGSTVATTDFSLTVVC